MSFLYLVKQEKAEKADKAETKTEKSEKSRKGSTKKAAAAVATADIDDSALDALGGDLLPLDGKDEFGDLLDVFDPHDSFHDVDVKPAAKATTTKKVWHLHHFIVKTAIFNNCCISFFYFLRELELVKQQMEK